MQRPRVRVFKQTGTVPRGWIYQPTPHQDGFLIGRQFRNVAMNPSRWSAAGGGQPDREGFQIEFRDLGMPVFRFLE